MSIIKRKAAPVKEVESEEASPKHLAVAYSMSKRKKARPEKPSAEETPLSKLVSGEKIEAKPMSIAEEIISRKKAKKMADGGMVDLDLSEEESPVHQGDGWEAKPFGEDIDESPDQPMDSDEHGDDIESDMHDMVSKIMSKMRSKRSR